MNIKILTLQNNTKENSSIIKKKTEFFFDSEACPIASHPVQMNERQ